MIVDKHSPKEDKYSRVPKTKTETYERTKSIITPFCANFRLGLYVQLLSVLCTSFPETRNRFIHYSHSLYDPIHYVPGPNHNRSQVKSDVGGNYKKMLGYALMERDEFVSHVIDEACDGFGTREKVLIDVSERVSLTFLFRTIKIEDKPTTYDMLPPASTAIALDARGPNLRYIHSNPPGIRVRDRHCFWTANTHEMNRFSVEAASKMLRRGGGGAQSLFDG